MKRTKKLTLREAFSLTRKHRWDRQKAGADAIACAERVLGVLGEGTPVTRVGEADVRRLVATLRFTHELAPGTVNRHLSALRALLDTAHTQGAIAEVPRFAWQAEPRGRIRWLSTNEQAELFASIYGINYHVGQLCKVLVDTGLRVGEALALKWADVELVGPSPRVTVRESKNGEQRVVPLTLDAAGVLRRRRGHASPFGMLSQSTVNHVFRAAREALPWAAGDDELVPHCLRHTCASRLTRAGVPTVIVGAWLGHRDVRSTLRYAHPDDVGLRSAARLLEGVQ